MSMRLRRNHSPAFKAKVALAAVRGEKTLAVSAQQYDVHPNLIKQWRARLLEGAADVGSSLEGMMARKAADAHCRRQRQQDGEDRLGAAHAQKGLQGSGPGYGIAPGRARGVGGCRRSQGGYGTTVGKTGLEEPGTGEALSKRAKLMGFQPANSHTGQRHTVRIERPDR